MTNAIGLRFYRVTFHEERSSRPIQADDKRLFHGDQHLLSEFLIRHTSVTNVDSAQRGWFFDTPTDTNSKTVSGRITYGIHGIESRLVNMVSRQEEFRRKSSHLEEIPLYFQFLRPKSESYLIFAFQSFGVRSCIYLVQSAFRDYIRDKTGLVVRFRKLLPAEAGIDPFSSGLVKEMILIKRKVSSDKVDAYRDDAPAAYDVKISLVAKGRTSFGSFRNLTTDKIKKAGHSVALIEEFDKAVVKVSLNGNSKHITMFGEKSEVGTIDVSDDDDLKIVDGHPTKESLDKITMPLMKFFNNALIGYK